MHYNDIFCYPWLRAQWNVVYQPSCLDRPYTRNSWSIRYPEVQWTDQTIVIMHTQDFLTIHDQRCPELRDMEQHFGDQSHRVIVVHWNYDLNRVYSGPLNLVYFPTHTYEIVENLRKEPMSEWRRRSPAPRHRRWQCLNGIPRAHRRLVHDWLKPHSNGVTCLGKIDPLIKDAYHDTYTWTGDPLINENNFLRLSWLYEHTWINIVTETQYTESPGIISEKTLFALLGQQIPIVIGYRGIVEDCRRIGFDMFDDIVDNSYDNLDDLTRWQQALELNQDLILGHSDLEYLRPRLSHQREWVLDQWPELMIKHYQQRSNEILENLTKI
jgi:hypothetical protein